MFMLNKEGKTPLDLLIDQEFKTVDHTQDNILEKTNDGIDVIQNYVTKGEIPSKNMAKQLIDEMSRFEVDCSIKFLK